MISYCTKHVTSIQLQHINEHVLAENLFTIENDDSMIIVIKEDQAPYEPKLPTAARTTISHTIMAAKKRISSTIINAIATMNTAPRNATLLLVRGK